MSDDAKQPGVTVAAYNDVLHPASKAIGEELVPAGKVFGNTLSRAIVLALSPIRGLIWSGEQIEQRIKESLEAKFVGKEGRIIPPHPIIAGPVLDALRFAEGEPTLRELYLNLLATAMDGETVLKAHPRFVEIIRQITPDEAKLVEQLSIRGKYNRLNCYPDDKVALGDKVHEYVIAATTLLAHQAGCQHPAMGRIYVENLTSLGLLDGPSHEGTVYYHPGDGMPEDRTDVAAMAKWLLDRGGEPRTWAQSGGWIKLSSLGQRFIEACVRPDAPTNAPTWPFTWD